MKHLGNNAVFAPYVSENAMTSQDDDIPASYASPPCFMHELDQSYVGLASESGAQHSGKLCVGERRSVNG